MIGVITGYFPHLTDKQKEQLVALFHLYEDWNSKINVISRKDMDQFYERHVLHSLAISKIIDFKPGTRILDVGTGGGFPGIPLAIMYPEVAFTLVDSIGKKVKVVNEVASALGLKNVDAQPIRAEAVKGQFDFILSRAVARMKPFYGWVHGKINLTSSHQLANGILYLKGGNLEEEMKELKKPYTLYQISDFFEEAFFETKQVAYIKG